MYPYATFTFDAVHVACFIILELVLFFIIPVRYLSGTYVKTKVIETTSKAMLTAQHCVLFQIIHVGILKISSLSLTQHSKEVKPYIYGKLCL